MNKKSPIEMERARIIKTTRTLLRLKHSLAADEEINELLPQTLEEFDQNLQQGKLLGAPNVEPAWRLLGEVANAGPETRG